MPSELRQRQRVAATSAEGHCRLDVGNPPRPTPDPVRVRIRCGWWLKDLNERAVAAEADAIEIEVNNAGDLDRALRRADSSSTTGYIAMTEAIDTTAAAVATGNLTYWISLYSYGHQ